MLTETLWSKSDEDMAVATRLRECCGRLIADLEGNGSQRVDATSAALKELASVEGRELSYLMGEGTAPTPSDIRSAMRDLAVLASCSWTVASIYMINRLMAGALIATGGTREQREILLPQIRSGTREFAFALTEPEAGSDAASLRTRATRSTDGFRIDGEKHYITGAASADDILVVARTGEKRAFGIFIVPRASGGLTVEVQEKLAMHQHASCRVVLEDVHVTEDSVVGGPEAADQAWSLLRYMGSLERTAVAAMAAGSATTVVDRCIDFAKERVQFGQPVAAFQSIQHTLVDMACTARVMHLLVEDVVAGWERGGHGTTSASMAKYLCAEHLQEVVGKAMRVLGGRAFFDHEDMSRFYREAPFALYAGGTNEIQRNLVARALGLTTR